MKNMKINTLLAILVFGAPLLPAFAQDAAPHHPDAQPAAQAATPQMPMQNMMEECQKRQQMLQSTLDEIGKTVSEAKKTNDPVQLHVALDQVEARLKTATEQTAKCREMMTMMQHMMTMPGRGMMNPPAR